jgi:hypothetical protein
VTIQLPLPTQNGTCPLLKLISAFGQQRSLEAADLQLPVVSFQSERQKPHAGGRGWIQAVGPDTTLRADQAWRWQLRREHFWFQRIAAVLISCHVIRINRILQRVCALIVSYAPGDLR